MDKRLWSRLLGPSLPPVECCIGTRPSQDPKSRPRSKQLISVAKASIAKAVCSPTPGIVFNLCTLPDAFAMVSSCFVRLETLAASVSMCSTYLTPMLSAYERQQRGVPKRVRHSSTSLLRSWLHLSRTNVEHQTRSNCIKRTMTLSSEVLPF